MMLRLELVQIQPLELDEELYEAPDEELKNNP